MSKAPDRLRQLVELSRQSYPQKAHDIVECIGEAGPDDLMEMSVILEAASKYHKDLSQLLSVLLPLVDSLRTTR